jgi:3',5'-cyclic-AMP phosphodiesterase
MPIHLCSLDRRGFLTVLGGSVVAISAGAARATEGARTKIEDDLIYLLNDTHIGEKQPPDSPVPSHLRQVVDELTGRETKPAAVLINGDLALKDGQPGDYRHLAQLLLPLREAQIDLHLTLGNHDHREVFYDVLKDQRPQKPVVAARHIAIVKTRHANFILLDSLLETMVTQGEIGEQQFVWLARTLDALSAKPAIVVAHHNPRLGGDPLHFPGGLIDSEPLWDLLTERRHVKAYVHGHIHDRSFAEHRGIHIINTPATSYVADRQTSTTGWTTARLRADGVELTTHTTDAKHPWNGQTRQLAWRA